MAVATTTLLVAGGAALLGAAATSYAAYKSAQTAKGMQAMSEEQYNQSMRQQQAQQAKLDKQKEIYKQFQFENPYAGVQNAFAGMKNMYAGMENTYADMENAFEDLRVSTGAAEFQMEQGAQQRADIMQTFRGAAGGSGIAGLAQAMAGQGALQARQVSADISQQEMRNEAMKAQGAMSIQQLESQGAMALQQMERQGAANVQQMKMQGAAAADMARRGGEAMLQEAEMSRQSTLLGIEYGGMGGANAAVQAAMGNQMASMAYGNQMQTQSLKALGQGMSALGSVDWGGGGGPGGGWGGKIIGQQEPVQYTYNP